MIPDPRVLVSVSGVRGIIGQGLTPELATRFAAALPAVVGRGRVVVGRDSRPSGRMLHQAVLAGLASVGCHGVDIGIAPTPTVGRAVSLLGAVGGIQITASHNPAEWNGLKLFGPDGAVLSAREGQRVGQCFQADDSPRVGWRELGRVVEQPGAHEEHAACVLKHVDVPLIRSRRFRVLLDANGGAGGPLARHLLDALGVTVTPVGCDPTGEFAHPPEPIPEHLGDLGPRIRQTAVDLAFVLDPDADRLAILDETGRPIGEELTLALAVQQRLTESIGSVVVNLSTSRVTEDVAHRAGAGVCRTPVGEANVVAGMRREAALIGGEGNGGVIDPRIGWVRDPFIGMALVLQRLAHLQQPLSAVVAALPCYHICKAKFTASRAGLPALYQRLKTTWPDAVADEQDGLRLDWPTAWVQIRPSNTEPVVRVIAEATAAAEAERLCHHVGQLAATT